MPIDPLADDFDGPDEPPFTDGAPAPAAMPGARLAYLDGLNPEQRAAVETLDGPVLVLAGAGTGKTRVLTTRLAHILATRRAFPGEVLAVTFTNKAAREMKERIGALIGGVVEGMQWLGTFHSIGAKMLRRHAELAGLKPAFTILDDDDQLRLLKQVIQAAGIDEKRWPPRQLQGLIDSWKNRAVTPDAVPPGEAHAYANGRGAELYRAYQQRLRELNAADFGDLLLEPILLLKAHPEVLAQYRRRFRYMLVDEYQDTNVAQYLWLRLLAGERGNLCCVGDDDQSIYGWRGAEVDNILRFEKDFPGARVIRLERNYRSTSRILGAASTLIAANRGRLGKTLWTEGRDGERVRVRGVWDAEEEARAIGEEIEDLRRQGQRLDAIAILVRASFQMREIEDRFITIGLPYRVVGGPRFYERSEIRDALAYLRAVHQPSDDLAVERILNKPKRGLGDTSVQALFKFARARRLPLLAAAREIAETDEITGKARVSLKALTENFARWSKAADGIRHTELAEMVLEESGYTEMWRLDKNPDAQGRLDNLKELVRSMEDFTSLGGFLEHIALVMEAGEQKGGDRVTLMTLHAAKGLEFDTVFLPGWEEGLFPSQRAMDENGIAGLEEERRLAYVGLTRARQSARLFYAANRRVHGLWASAIPSRFIGEMAQEHVEMTAEPGLMASGLAEGAAARFDSAYGSPGWRRGQENTAFRSGWRPSTPPRTIEAQATLVATSDPTAARYAKGDRVFHDKFGSGRVIHADGNKLTVAFDVGGEKKVVDSFLKPGRS